MGVQLQYINISAQTIPQVPTWEERAKVALETSVSWFLRETGMVCRGGTETKTTKAAEGDRAASASLCLLFLAY